MVLGREKTPSHGNNFKHEVWRKNNKALLKAEDLKGLLGYPTCKLLGFTSTILRIKRFVEPVFKTDDRR